NAEAEAFAKRALEGAARAEADVDTQQRLEAKRAHLRRRGERILLSWTSFTRPVVTEPADPFRFEVRPPAGDDSSVPADEAAADLVLRGGPPTGSGWVPSLPAGARAVLAGWSLGSGATRGGVLLWLTRLRLVQTDGRAATRRQCAGRALLACLPAALLLGLSLSVEGWRLTRGIDGSEALLIVA